MLEVRLLGKFEVQLEGKPVEIPSRPAQSLLSYLILNAGVAHRREKLAGLLWPDSDETNARSNHMAPFAPVGLGRPWGIPPKEAQVPAQTMAAAFFASRSNRSLNVTGLPSSSSPMTHQ